MEQASLRPVPLRPPGPVDHGEAAAHVAAALPKLDETAARALGLVEIAGRTRSQVAAEAGLSPEALADALTRARKALRRTIFPLSAAGWCERAERMISDRIDGELRAPGPRRLQVHLENCDRCVEHDRRLAQAREQLVRDFIDAHPHADVVPHRERQAAGLRVVQPVAVEEEVEDVPPGPVLPSFGGPAPDPVLGEAGGDLPGPGFAGPLDGWTSPPVEREIAPVEPAATAEPAAPVEPAATAEIAARIEAVAPAVEVEPVAASEPVATPEPAVASQPSRRPTGRQAGNVLWSGLYAVAILFAILTIVLLVAALAGVDRIL